MRQLICAMPDLDYVASAADRAAEFLSASITSGRYTLVAYSSDGSPCPVHDRGRIFPGFWVASALEGRMQRSEIQVMRRRIHDEDRGGLWGDCTKAPVDADDTAFALRTLSLFGDTPDESGLLRFYKRESRFFPTFYSSRPIALAFERTLDGNFMAHPEVAANIFHVLWSRNRRAYINYDLIADSQSQDGDWRSYFYPSRYYATFVFCHLLQRMNRMKDERLRAIDFIRGSRRADGMWGSPANACDTALALNTLQLDEWAEGDLARSVDALLESQLCDGSWSVPQAIWLYPATAGVEWAAYDFHRVIGTAVCLMCLRKLLAGRPARS
jgi:hypothetical protein